MRRLSAALIGRPTTLVIASGFLVLLTALPAHAQNCAPPPAGLISWWPLDETSGTAVADILGRNPGTASAPIGSASTPKSMAGFVGTGMNFAFKTQVTAGPNKSLDFETDKSFTIDAWFKGQPGPIVSNYSMSTRTGFFLQFDPTNDRLTFSMGIGAPVNPPVATWNGPLMKRDVWTFVAVVVDRTNQKVTLHTSTGGPLTSSSSGPLPMPANANAGTNLPLAIGGCPGNPNGCNAVIDELEIFDRALDPKELQTIVSAGKAGKCKSPPTNTNTKGMTWRWGGVNATTGTVIVGCGASDPVHPCNASVGDQLCTDSLPLLCFKPTPILPKPASVVETPYYYLWSGGIVGTTAPVAPAAPPISSSLTNANKRCADEFGAGWRVAEFHDGAQGKGGWDFLAYGNMGDTKTRFWVHINDQPKGTCFPKP
jgi:hypothetical protein